MEKFQETYEEWAELNRRMYRGCREYLERVLGEAPGHTIDMDCEDSVCVSYDGGNHPEYASNCYSVVNAAYLKDGKVYLDTEDTDEYSIERLNACELYDVADLVERLIENN